MMRGLNLRIPSNIWSLDFKHLFNVGMYLYFENVIGLEIYLQL